MGVKELLPRMVMTTCWSCAAGRTLRPLGQADRWLAAMVVERVLAVDRLSSGAVVRGGVTLSPASARGQRDGEAALRTPSLQLGAPSPAGGASGSSSTS